MSKTFQMTIGVIQCDGAQSVRLSVSIDLRLMSSCVFSGNN